MKCQILFSGKNNKNTSKCCQLKILAKVLSVNLDLTWLIYFGTCLKYDSALQELGQSWV